MKISKAKLKRLAGILIGTSGNVFREHERLFGSECDDLIFDRLQKEEKIERCEECDVWKDSSDMSRDVCGYCQSCADEI